MAECEILLWNMNAYFCLSLPGALWGMCAVCFAVWTFSRLQQTCLDSAQALTEHKGGTVDKRDKDKDGEREKWWEREGV